MNKEQIDQKYIDQANALEVEFFDIVDEGKRSQHRILKTGKSQQDFNTQHGQIWKNHEQELMAGGYLKLRPEPEPTRDLATEIDNLKARIQLLESR